MRLRSNLPTGRYDFIWFFANKYYCHVEIAGHYENMSLNIVFHRSYFGSYLFSMFC